MLRFAIRRIGAGIPLIIGIVVFLFVLLELAPGDPVQAIVGDFPVPDEYRAQLVAEYNLDAPLLERFSTYATTLLRGDLGESFYNERSVSELIRARLPNTLLLISVGMAASFVIGTALGLLSASTKRSGVDSGVSSVQSLRLFDPELLAGPDPRRRVRAPSRLAAIPGNSRPSLGRDRARGAANRASLISSCPSSRSACVSWRRSAGSPGRALD